jgi:hypothetical protein
MGGATRRPIGAMPDYNVYKVYLIGDEGHSPEQPEIITCTSDQEAASRAVDLSSRKVAELWQGTRLVAIFPKRSEEMQRRRRPF